VTYPSNGMLFGHKRNEIPINALTWVNPENNMVSEKRSHTWPYTAWLHFLGKSRVGKSKETVKVNGCQGSRERGDRE
jgi:hypothetical protein